MTYKPPHKRSNSISPLSAGQHDANIDTFDHRTFVTPEDFGAAPVYSATVDDTGHVQEALGSRGPVFLRRFYRVTNVYVPRLRGGMIIQGGGQLTGLIGSEQQKFSLCFRHGIPTTPSAARTGSSSVLPDHPGFRDRGNCAMRDGGRRVRRRQYRKHQTRKRLSWRIRWPGNYILGRRRVQVRGDFRTQHQERLDERRKHFEHTVPILRGRPSDDIRKHIYIKHLRLSYQNFWRAAFEHSIP